MFRGMTETELEEEFSDIIEEWESTPVGRYVDPFSFSYFEGNRGGVFDVLRAEDGGAIVLLSTYPIEEERPVYTLQQNSKDGCVYALDQQYNKLRCLAKFSVTLEYALAEIKYYAMNLEMRENTWRSFIDIDPEI